MITKEVYVEIEVLRKHGFSLRKIAAKLGSRRVATRGEWVVLRDAYAGQVSSSTVNTSSRHIRRARFHCFQANDVVPGAWKGNATDSEEVRRDSQVWFKLRIGIGYRYAVIVSRNLGNTLVSLFSKCMVKRRR